MSLVKKLQIIKKKILLDLSELEEFFSIIESKASNLDNHEKELEDLNKKVEEKRTELESFRRVSFISNMSKQLKEKDNYIEVLEKRIVSLSSRKIGAYSPKSTTSLDQQSPVKCNTLNNIDKIKINLNGGSGLDSVDVEEIDVLDGSVSGGSGDYCDSTDEDDIEVIKKRYKGVYYYVSEEDKQVFKIEDDLSIGEKVGILNKKGKIRLNKSF